MCVLPSRSHNVGKTGEIKIATSLLEMTQFKHLGTTVTTQNLIQDKLRGD
jgi:hypothetical protein